MTMFQEASLDSAVTGSQRTTSPIVTGTSVLALRYKDGIMMMADTLGSYGSLAMFKHVPRLHKITQHTMIGASGEYSDLQFLLGQLKNLTERDAAHADGSTLQPSEIHSYLSRVMYNRRSKIDPLWNTVITGGIEQSSGDPFLGFVDLYGSNFVGDVLVTGYGQHLALPLLRNEHKNGMSEADAKALLEKCMRVLIYRDCRTLNSFLFATVTKQNGVQITEPFEIKTEWSFDRFVDPHKA